MSKLMRKYVDGTQGEVMSNWACGGDECPGSIVFIEFGSVYFAEVYQGIVEVEIAYSSHDAKKLCKAVLEQLGESSHEAYVEELKKEIAALKAELSLRSCDE